jgi:hypothetical protein
MAGTFTISAPSTTPIDINCVVQSMKLVSMPSGPLTPVGYDPFTGIPTAGTFCLCVGNANDSTLKQWYNYDVWSNPGFMKGIIVPITPQPPPAVPLHSLVCTSCPPGCQFQIVTV